MVRAPISLMTLCCSTLIACTSGIDLYRDLGSSAEEGPLSDLGEGQACRLPSDCVAGLACSFHQGCVPFQSGSPPSGGGAVKLGARCVFDDPDQSCAAGLTCVEQNLVYDEAAASFRAYSGLCLRVCDPHAYDCPEGQHCFQLDGGGGACHAGALRSRDEACIAAVCQPGLSCERGVCLLPCVPEMPALLSGQAAPSNACGSEVCRYFPVVDPPRPFYECAAGRLVRTGDLCRGRLYCRPPDECTRLAGEGWYCSPPDCGGGCPEETSCVSYLSRSACVRHGVSGIADPCFIQEQCMLGLVCDLIYERCLLAP